MKKLMIAAAVAAMGAGAFAECFPDEGVEVARVYQIQMNVYTTKGVYVGAAGGSACEPGECVVMRGKDKTVLRGYAYLCESACDFSDYQVAFCDSRRKAIFEEAALEWAFINVIGKNSAAIGTKDCDAECSWTFAGTCTYDEERAQEYDLRGSGYATYKASTEGFYDNLGGYFAGTATAPYDLRRRTASGSDDDCFCTPSQVLKCDDGFVEFVDELTVAFGTWKMKFNANVTKAMLTYAGSEESFMAALLKKAMQ